MNKITFYLQAVLLLITGLFAGCASTSYGTKMDQNKISQIKKGVTTKAEVEALLGPPAHISIIPGASGDGRRMMQYSFYEMSAKPTAASFIPVVGGFVGGSQQQRTQSLQIIITKSGVVEDYEYSDSTNHSEGGLLNRKTVASPTEQEK